MSDVPERIRFSCACGARLSSAPERAGKTVDCPRCGVPVTVPAEGRAAPSMPVAAPFRPASSVGRRPPAPVPSDPRWQAWARWALGLALLPLAVALFSRAEDVEARLKRMVERDPSLGERLAKAETEEEVFGALPGGRVDGALHARSTSVHWLYAAVSAAAFWCFLLLAYPKGTATSTQMWLLGLFTGTIGILMLLAVQWIALHTSGFVIGRGLLTILFLVIRFIGFSYRAALDAGTGFFASMLGFTFGVGLCEELCKILPILWAVRRSTTLDVRGITLLGLATGVGFGVSEGITYSSDFYNGLSGGGIYVVRFVSCVALHAVWSATSGLLLWRMQAEVDGIDAWYEWAIPILKVIGISMVLHGFYDTFLKREMNFMALVTAVASFVLFFWLYERTVVEEKRVVAAYQE